MIVNFLQGSDTGCINHTPVSLSSGVFSQNTSNSMLVCLVGGGALWVWHCGCVFGFKERERT